MRAARWFLDGEAERRAAGTPGGARDRGQPSSRRHRRHARRPRRPHRPHPRRLRDLRLQDRLDADRSEAPRRYLQLPIEAAIAAAGGFDGLQAAPATRLELIRFGGSEPEVIPLDTEPRWRRPGRGSGAWSATTSTRPPASSPACGRASTRATTTTCRASASGPTATTPTRSPGHDRRDRRPRSRAARPDASSWVSANAGSGKTRVLTDRVARLLLAGTEPQRILCLTYTKAAAAEMQNRLFRTLGGWAMLDDADLRAALRSLGEPGDTHPAGPARTRPHALRARARDPRRPADPDDPRLLREPAAPLPARGRRRAAVHRARRPPGQGAARAGARPAGHRRARRPSPPSSPISAAPSPTCCSSTSPAIARPSPARFDRGGPRGRPRRRARADPRAAARRHASARGRGGDRARSSPILAASGPTDGKAGVILADALAARRPRRPAGRARGRAADRLERRRRLHRQGRPLPDQGGARRQPRPLRPARRAGAAASRPPARGGSPSRPSPARRRSTSSAAPGSPPGDAPRRRAGCSTSTT